MTFTVFPLLCSLLALVAAWLAWRFASDAALESLELRKARADIAAHGAVLQQLGQQIQKLRGQFFAFKQQVEDDDGEYPHTDARIAPTETQLEFCENWQTARKEGPLSPAAKCECTYCATQRAARRSVRASLLPPTVAAQARMIEDVANGRE